MFRGFWGLGLRAQVVLSHLCIMRVWDARSLELRIHSMPGFELGRRAWAGSLGL